VAGEDERIGKGEAGEAGACVGRDAAWSFACAHDLYGRELSLTGDEPAGGGLRRQRRFEPGERHERRREKAREVARHAGADDVADVGNDRREVGWWRRGGWGEKGGKER
jgi:hypothetical protein